MLLTTELEYMLRGGIFSKNSELGLLIVIELRARANAKARSNSIWKSIVNESGQ